MDDNLYEILNIEHYSTNEEIKKQYKQLALKYHPDKFDGDESMFKKITNAYNILSNQDKKELYDLQLKKKSFSDTNYIFEEAFKSKKDIIKIVIKLSLNDVLNGCTKKYEYIEKVNCKNCDGTGIDNPKINTIKCIECNGRGVHKDMSFLSCMKCNGKGIFILNEKKCRQCSGLKVFYIKKEDIITIESNVKDNTVFKPCKLVEICVKYDYNDNKFYSIKYENQVIYVKIYVSVIDLVCGFQKEIVICNKKYLVVNNEIFDINLTIHKQYTPNISIIFKFILKVDKNDTKMVTKKLFRSFRNVLGIKPFDNSPPNFEIINIQN